MKRLIATTCLSVLLIWLPQAAAQDCKPDGSGTDKISRQQNDVWWQVLSSTSFGSNLLSSSDSKIILIVGRYGASNTIALQIEKRERSVVNAALESPYRAAVGQPFYFGFKNGEPLTFVVTEVNNQAGRGKGLNDDKLITTVVLAATIDDARMAVLRKALTSTPVDAVRMNLAGDLQIEKSVSDKNGEAMRKKFACFYESLDKGGIDLSAAVVLSPGEPLAKVIGKYIRKDKTSDYIDVNGDGTFSMRQDGKDVTGTLAVRGDTVTITQAGRTMPAGRLVGNSLVDPGGTIWERAPAPQKDAGPKLLISA